MRQEILNELSKITPEEAQALSGEIEYNRTLYQTEQSLAHPEHPGTIFDAQKLMDSGRLITIRKHTRFTHFPKHSHNYVEVIYMCKGSTHHIINDNDVILEEGELLFLNQNAIQEILPAGENDIAVNFIILPAFFDYALTMLDVRDNPLRSFVIDCMRGEIKTSAYLHFKISDVLPIQNLIENLIWTLMNKQQNNRSLNQATMGLLMMHLMNYADTAETDNLSEGEKLAITVLSYIEGHYKDAELASLADAMHYDVYFLSREIKRLTGQNYTDLLQNKRLSQAAYLLSHTKMSVSDISVAVGYENISYFHRIFQKKYGMTPRHYRIQTATSQL
ncbi:MAG: helix-turn-helix domain-containing protein [Lachnospiraceae bacterium]|nr:helix-turn-helix domain-containing protein [Lachnospiraceae bacterium]